MKGMMEMERMGDKPNGLVINAILSFVVKRNIIEDTLKLLNELIKIYNEKSPYFKFKKLKSKPKCCQYILHHLRLAGIIEKQSKNGNWKIVDYETLKKIYLNLQRCYVDEKERNKWKYMGDMTYNNMQGIMYSVGRMIGIKENCSTVEAITSILIAYYIENYGEDEFIKGILKKFDSLKKVVEIENKFEKAVVETK